MKKSRYSQDICLNFVLSFAMVCTLLAGINVVAFAAEDTLSVICFYNDAEKGGDGEHLFTKDEGEMSWLSSLPTWNNYGEAWKAPVSSSLAIYRCYNPNSGEHHYAAAGEAEWLVSIGWTQEKLAFYSDDNMGVPVYRLWNGLDGVGSHYYTTDEGEAAWLVSIGWKAEGVNFYGVKEEVPGEIESVVIDNMSPKVGDTITATPVDGNGEEVVGLYKYQWYRTGGVDQTTKAITGETNAKYTVQPIDVNYFLYCEVTTLDGEVFQSKTTARIQATEIEKLEITGMSGKKTPLDKTPTVPVVGDTLKADETPDAGDLLNYQWYRGDSKITGATKSTYTLVDGDWESTIKCVVTAKDTTTVKFVGGGDSLTATTENKVAKSVEDADIKLSQTTVAAGEDITCIVKYDGSSLPAGSVTYQWYQDTVSADTALAGHGANTDTYSVQPKDVGHDLICVVTGNYAKYWVGTDAVATGTRAELTGVTLTSDSINTTLGEGSVLTANLADIDRKAGAKATYTFKRNKTVVQTGSDPEYVITEEDIEAVGEGNIVPFTVIATGDEDYGWSGQVTSPALNVTLQEDAEVQAYSLWQNGLVQKVNAATATLPTGNDVCKGDTLSVKVNPEIAQYGDVVVNWYKKDGANPLEMVAEDALAFTIPSSWDNDWDLVVEAYYVGADDNGLTPSAGTATSNTTWAAKGAAAEVVDQEYYLQVYTDKDTVPAATAAATTYRYTLDVNDAVTSVDLTFDNGQTKSSKTYVSYDNPQVGAVAHANVTPMGAMGTYMWFHASDLIYGMDPADAIGFAKDYTITSEDINESLVCVFMATTGSYAGAAVTSNPTMPVVASNRTIAEIKVAEYTVTVPTDLTTAGFNNNAPKTKKQYEAIKSATKIEAGKYYAVYGLDSEGNVLTYANLLDTPYPTFAGSNVVWDGSESSEYLSYLAWWQAESDTGIVTVAAVPDTYNYVGDNAYYQFTTEPGEEGTVTYTATTGSYKDDKDLQHVNVTADIQSSLNVSTSATIEKIQWYEASKVDGAGIAIAETEPATKGSTTTKLNAAATTAGNYYYVVYTDSNGKTYTGNRVLAEAAALTTLDVSAATVALTDNVDGTGTEAITGIKGKDQFGNAIAAAQTTGTTTVTSTIADTNVTQTAASALNAGAINVTLKNNSTTVAGNVATTDKATITFNGKTYTVAYDAGSIAKAP